MKARLILAATLLGMGLALPGFRAHAAPAAVEKKQPSLAGKWKGYAVEGKGENPDRGPVKLELTITDKEIHGVELKQSNEIDHGSGSYTVDDAATPHNLDAAKTGPNGRPEQYLGIYQLDGDTLKWCVTRQKKRPTTFETSKGQFLLILKRDK